MSNFIKLSNAKSSVRINLDFFIALRCCEIVTKKKREGENRYERFPFHFFFFSILREMKGVAFCSLLMLWWYVLFGFWLARFPRNYYMFFYCLYSTISKGEEGCENAGNLIFRGSCKMVKSIGWQRRTFKSKIYACM